MKDRDLRVFFEKQRCASTAWLLFHMRIEYIEWKCARFVNQLVSASHFTDLDLGILNTSLFSADMCDLELLAGVQ